MLVGGPIHGFSQPFVDDIHAELKVALPLRDPCSACRDAGIDTELLKRIDKIEYWYFWKEDNQRVRYHKFVYFYLLKYRSGNVKNHDQEVNEAKWFEISDAINQLAFASEKKIVEHAVRLIDEMG